MDNSLKEQSVRTIKLATSINGKNKYYDDKVYEKSIDNSVTFSLNGDYVERLISIPEVGNNVFKSEKVMDKKTFIECYKKWIVQEKE